ncbi:cupin domain-containing protein [Knoellia sp. S7-12]|uniref:cupin domain-containing protein n=1 Tax=Knoellia sp. S7-12 TaxID=3126698 RepID=UPI0033662299
MTAHHATLVRRTDAEALDASGVTLLADTPATGGAVTSHRSSFRAGRPGAPPHLHREASELFHVLGGSLEVLLGESLTTLEKGDFLLVPPHLPHAFEAAGTEDADVFFVLTDAKPRFDYYRLLEQVYRGEVDPAELAATQDTYDNHYVDSAIWADRTGSPGLR